MSKALKPIWGDDSLVFQWGDFSPQEQATLIDLHEPIVLQVPDESFALARRAMDAFREHFALLQDMQSFDPQVRIICCYVHGGKLAECKKLPSLQQPTYAIKVNIHAVHLLERQASFVSNVLCNQLSKRTTLSSETQEKRGNCALVALMFVFFHELAHIVRGHLEWSFDSARQERRALELDADFIGAGYCAGFIRQFFGPGVEQSDAQEATRVNRSLAVSLIHLLMEGCKTEVQERPSNAGILDFFPDRHEKESAELRDITAPRLLELERAGRLRGWRL